MKLVPLDTTTPFGARRAGAWERLSWGLATMRLPAPLKRRIRRRVRRFAGPFDVRVPAPGAGQGPDDPNAKHLLFRAYPSENYCDRILVGRDRLPEEREHLELARFAELHPVETFVDIGANVGAYSVFVGATMPSARILAFEPHPRTAAKLRFNLAVNGIEADVVEAAVGGAPGRMELWSDGGGNIGQTSLLPEATSNAKVAVEVAVVTLADALAKRNIERIGLLKIDVEGFEDRALAPFLAHASDEALPRAILLEGEHASLWEVDLEERLRSLGYRAAFRSAMNTFYVRPA